MGYKYGLSRFNIMDIGMKFKFDTIRIREDISTPSFLFLEVKCKKCQKYKKRKYNRFYWELKKTFPVHICLIFNGGYYTNATT